MPPNRPTHFLLVEDEEDHAVLVQRALSENRVVNIITHVWDGDEAMEFMRGTGRHVGAPRPDVVLLDLKLPRRSGHEVLEELKRDPVLRTIPVVVMTTSRAEADRERAYLAHVNSYLVKPLDFGQFQEMIRELRMYWAIWNEPPT